MEYFWEKNNWIESDKHLSTLKHQPFERLFQPLPSGPGLYSIRGPRQIGKTSWLKTLLAKENPSTSFYLSCENIKDYQDLNEIIKSVKNRSCLFFDEITFVKEWWRAIKHKLDSDPKVKVFITGSHAFDVRKGIDKMPGRWGHGGEYELLPMDFIEFQSMRKQAGWPKLSHEEELQLYFHVGGFPISLIESGPEGKPPLKAMKIYQQWLLGDLLKIGRSEEYLKQILVQIALTMSSTISLQKLAQKTQIGSHNTAQDYIELLDACFALKTIYAMNPNDGSPHMRKNKKIYFRDPLIYWLSLKWAGVPKPINAYSQIAEQVAFEHLLRKYKNFGYYSDDKGEVDFFKPKHWAVEIKWRDLNLGLSTSFKNLKVPEKIVWSKNNFMETWPSLSEDDSWF